MFLLQFILGWALFKSFSIGLSIFWQLLFMERKRKICYDFNCPILVHMKKYNTPKTWYYLISSGVLPPLLSSSSFPPKPRSLLISCLLDKHNLQVICEELVRELQILRNQPNKRTVDISATKYLPSVQTTQPAITCSKLTIETLERDVKNVQS